MAFSVLHLFEDDAFFHLTDILFLDYTHQVLEGVIDFVGVELVTLAHTLAQKVIAALFGEDRDFICCDRVDMVGETKLGFHYSLAFLAHIYTLSKQIGVLIEEEERETGDELLLVGSEDLYLIFLVLVVVVKDLNRTPDVFLVLVYW